MSSRALVTALATTCFVEIVAFGLSTKASDDRPLGGDGISYDRLAQSLMTGRGLTLDTAPPYEPTLSRAPGYPLFLAACYKVFGTSPASVRLIQLGLLAAMSYLLFELLTDLASRRVAAVAALLCATYLPLVTLATYHLTETLASFLLVSSLLLLARAVREKARLRLCCSGIAVGGLGLVRPSLLLLALPFAAWAGLCWRPRRAAPGAVIVFLVASAGPILPWVARNTLVSGVPKLTAGEGGPAWSRYVSLQQWGGDISPAPRLREWQAIIREFNDRLRRAQDRSGVSTGMRVDLLVEESYAESQRTLREAVTVRQMLSHLPLRLVYLWSTADVPLWPLAPVASAWVHRVAQVQFALLVALGGVGLWCLRERAFSRLGLLWIAACYLTLLHLYFHAEPRYTIPGRPLLFVFPAHAVTWILSLRTDATRGSFLGSGSATEQTSEQLERTPKRRH